MDWHLLDSTVVVIMIILLPPTESSVTSLPTLPGGSGPQRLIVIAQGGKEGFSEKQRSPVSTYISVSVYTWPVHVGTETGTVTESQTRRRIFLLNDLRSQYDCRSENVYDKGRIRWFRTC
ncbi:hypothetical protein GGS20DRAFT_46549 [Poronia punctata]|nr:hypothetical protein GGS20DRAFT_46549 [Poronia punctata]